MSPQAAPAESSSVADSLENLDDPRLYLNRETSWLAFNARVLDQAVSPDFPLLERLKFLAIHASNLDEFFMIRVSGLHEQLEAELIETAPDGLSPREQLTRIGQQLRAQLDTASRLLAQELLPALAEQGIVLRRWDNLDQPTRRLACDYFRQSVFPVLTPLAVDPGHPSPSCPTCRCPWPSRPATATAASGASPGSRSPRACPASCRWPSWALRRPGQCPPRSSCRWRS
jgi:polyphosphate kinase